MFDGRLAENFKLATGTWVAVGALRTAFVSACAGVIQDSVIAGHDRDCVTALAWVNQPEARRVLGAQEDLAPHDPQLRAHLTGALRRLNSDRGSAARIERVLIVAEPFDLDAGEITDKGYVNQHAVLTRRAAAVELLYAEPAPAAVIHAPC
jgi:feruloyl-CoA synthase